MSQFRVAVLASLLVMGAFVSVDQARAQTRIATPGTSGDQLIFVYDATPGRVTFLVVSNLAPSPVTLNIQWYSQDLNSLFATQITTLAIGANRILDPSQFPGRESAGITVVTPIRNEDDQTPVVPPPVNDTLPTAASGPLVGGFTLADTSSGSAFGQNPLARVAVDASGNRAPAGSVVDGTTIRYQQIAPDALVIPFYFNPNSGVPLTNRAILAAFADGYAGSIFVANPVDVTLNYGIIDASGADVASGTLPVNGVTFADVQSLAGATVLAGSGKVLLGVNAPLPANANLLGLFSQSLGTFAVGQVLPGYFSK